MFKRGKESEAPRRTEFGEVILIEKKLFRGTAHILFSNSGVQSESARVRLKDIDTHGKPIPIREGYWVAASVVISARHGSELKPTQVELSGYGKTGGPINT